MVTASKVGEFNNLPRIKGLYYTHPKCGLIRIQKLRWKQRIVCAFDERINTAGMKTLQIIVSPTDNILSLKYISGILSSKILNFWCTNYLADDMNQTYLEMIPIPQFIMTEINQETNQSRMVALVERMLNLHQQLAAAKTAQRKTVLQRQIDATDHEIDRLVYELYELSEAEIRIVEGG